MREITRLPAGELEHKAERDEGRIERLLGDAIKRSGRKIVVLDDDPTGVQTVHDVLGVYGLVGGIRAAGLSGGREPVLYSYQSRALQRTRQKRPTRRLPEI